MAWVTWRQHRIQAFAAGGMLLALGLAAIATGLPIHSAFHRGTLVACLPPSSRAGCDIIVRHFRSEYLTQVDALRGLVVLPALVGLFVGAPLLARELEHGTYRLAWTQGLARSRWFLTKAALLGAATVVAAATLAALVMWWRSPFDTFDGRIDPASFDVEGIVVPAYAVFALALGTLMGLLLRRTVAAMTATVIAYVAVRAAVAEWLRPAFLAPLHQSAPVTSTAAAPRGWVLSSRVVDASGRPIDAAREDLAVVHAQLGHIDPHEYLASLGWQRIVSYQPESRFWTFQLLEAGVFVALAVLIVAATAARLHRSPA